MPLPTIPHKYGAVATVVDNVRFASKAEARRYGELKLLQKAGEISGLVLQPGYPLIANGTCVGHYVGDFFYRDRAGKVVVEDVKGVATPVYRLKKRLMKACYDIDIVEVKA